MADIKLTAQDALTAIADGDLLYVVDVSDTTDAATGSSKKITRANLFTTNTEEVHAVGTAYSLTDTPALLDFGTTDPSIVLGAAGTYLLISRVMIKYNAATYAGNQVLTIKLRRTNNTAADITGSTSAYTMRIITTITDSFEITLPPVLYTTAVADDIVQMFGSIAAAPAAGSVDAIEASIVAVKLY